ncbi:unnamed protein product [Effrenium voratum]|nr:unnamed protein product [Effrenium voratum]
MGHDGLRRAGSAGTGAISDAQPFPRACEGGFRPGHAAFKGPNARAQAVQAEADAAEAEAKARAAEAVKAAAAEAAQRAAEAAAVLAQKAAAKAAAAKRDAPVDAPSHETLETYELPLLTRRAFGVETVVVSSAGKVFGSPGCWNGGLGRQVGEVHVAHAGPVLEAPRNRLPVLSGKGSHASEGAARRRPLHDAKV